MSKSINAVRRPWAKIKIDTTPANFKEKLVAAIRFARAHEQPEVEIFASHTKEQKDMEKSIRSAFRCECKDGENWCYTVVNHQAYFNIFIWLNCGVPPTLVLD